MTTNNNLAGSSKVLVVDLNNFARYPTLSIGYLVSILRNANFEVKVFAPLMIGIGGVTRESRPSRVGWFFSQVNYLVATGTFRWLSDLRERIASWTRSQITAKQDDIAKAFHADLLHFRPDAVLVSSYLMYLDLCKTIAELSSKEGIPVIVGGPYFAQPEVIEEWAAIRGIAGLVAGELELQLPTILRSVIRRADLSMFPGLVVSDSQGIAKGSVAPPNCNLDAIPYPDFSDFPWIAYPNRIAPIVTGRGCSWGNCTFCSDVTSTAGRTFRTRSPANVLGEIANHHRKYGVSLFAFTDLKLNSNVEMWRAICSQMQVVAPGAKWIASIHVGLRSDEGLALKDLQAAATSGCVRLTTGLETGSQRMAKDMRKGTKHETTSRFLREAAEAGISCRCTMIIGYPGETAEDVGASAQFLEEHSHSIERIALNRFQIMTGTSIHRSIQRNPNQFKGFAILDSDHAKSLIRHSDAGVRNRAYRRAALRLLRIVHRINSKELSSRAKDFEGAM